MKRSVEFQAAFNCGWLDSWNFRKTKTPTNRTAAL
jgi:hypothetical protein